MSERAPRSRSVRRRLLVPEVIQTSAMDCGPAVLQSLLAGFRIPVSYGRLREACHTDVDGTSIDTLEDIACALGLDAEQVMIPADHVLLPEASTLPAIAVVNSAMGGIHFVLLWRTAGPFVQTMDPVRGRVWLSRRSLLDRLYRHSTHVDAEAWRAWAGTREFLEPLARRLRSLGLSPPECDRQLGAALEDPSWKHLAALDAATRLASDLRTTGALNRGETGKAIEVLVRDARERPESSAIPEAYWTVRSAPADCGTERLALQAAVLVRAKRHETGAPLREETTVASRVHESPEIEAARREEPPRPLRHVLSLLRTDGVLGFGILTAAMSIAVLGVLLEALLLRSLLDVGLYLRTVEQGLAAAGAFAVFAIAMLLLEFGLGAAEQRAGRRLETRLRIAFFGKVSRLPDAYFQSRPVSDMAERGHGLHLLRRLPRLGVRTLRLALELAVTTAAIAWLAPQVAVAAAGAAVLAGAIPLVGNGLLADRDLRVRTHAGALGRFHLDALLGRTAIEAHGAGDTIEREHEHLLKEWVRASLAFQRGALAIEGAQMLVGLGLAGWIVFTHLGTGSAGATLILAYWVLNMPALGYELALCTREYPAQRSALLRLLEPLGAREDRRQAPAPVSPSRPALPARISAASVSVDVTGHRILENIDLEVPPGAHVAIVGSSGAGKSTLLGLILGWYRPSEGEFQIDGVSLQAWDLETLRAQVAWVDPTVRLWNLSLLENLRYGSTSDAPLAPVLEAAGLLPVVARLPEGLATRLGEGGALLSAGEAQRVRLARAMLKPAPRLILLDEPFLGLERDQRRTLLGEIRQRWSASTLLYVTHDLTEARTFDRVVVIDHGRIVEDGDPRQLLLMASSRFRRLLQAQEAVHARLHTGTEWRRVRMHEGQLVQVAGNAGIEQTA